MWESRDPILEFWEPLIPRERLKPDTSNLTLRLTAVSADQKNAKLGKKSIFGSHVTQFWNFGKLAAVSSNERYAKLGQKRSGRGFT